MSGSVAPPCLQDQIAFAAGAGMLVRIERIEVEDGWITGHIAAYSEELATIAVMSEHIDYNGFETILIDDISDIALPHPHSAFLEEALRLAGRQRPDLPEMLVFDHFSSLLQSLIHEANTVALHRELAEPDACSIGVIESVTPLSVSLYELTPDAEFEYSPTAFPLDEITKIDFGGAYEQALLAVAKNRGFDIPRR